MMNYPQTKEEARVYRYNRWAGNPRGWDYRENHCAMEVQATGRAIHFFQCSRLNGKGPDGLYCNQHAKKVEKEAEAQP